MTPPSPTGERVVVVTGGSSGIGAAAVAAFKALGDSVASFDSGAVNPDADLGIVGDVTAEADVRAALAEVEDKLGPVEVLVTCAGISRPGTVVDGDVGDWDETFAVNVRGLFTWARAVIPQMRERGGGAIVTVASQLGLVAARDSAAYCASKGAVIQLSRAMALDHAPEGVRVNCVCPGPTETPMLQRRFVRDGDPQTARERHLSMQATGRFVTPAEVAAGIEYLASPEAASTVGATLVIDGGFSIW